MIEAANLACIHKQIHSEFGMLFILRGNLRLKLEDLYKGLHHFFVRYPSSALEDLHCVIDVVAPFFPSHSINVLAVVSVLHRYPLLRIVWLNGCEPDDDGEWRHEDLASVVMIMVARHSEEPISVKLSHEECHTTLELSIVLEKGVSKQTIQDWKHGWKSAYRWGDIDVTVHEQDLEDSEDKQVVRWFGK
jgi:hypothetical protein